MEAFLHDLSWAVAMRHDALTPVFLGLTWLGYTTFFLIALPVGYWAWNKDKITRVALIVLVSALLNAFLKDLWQNPRPDPAFWIDPHMDASFGLPSGHTQVGIVMWFWLAHEIGKRWAWIVAAVLAGGIAFSRLYLGVHDVEDILGGAVIGIATLALYRWSFTEHFNWWRALSFPARLAVMIAALALTAFVWPGGAGTSMGAGGFLVAWYAGAVFDQYRIRFAPGPGWWRRVVTSVLGIVGVLFLFEMLSGLQASIAPESALLATVNGLIVGGAVVVLFPVVFQGFLLARRLPR